MQGDNMGPEIIKVLFYNDYMKTSRYIQNQQFLKSEHNLCQQMDEEIIEIIYSVFKIHVSKTIHWIQLIIF